MVILLLIFSLFNWRPYVWFTFSPVTVGGVRFVVCDKWDQQQENVRGSLWGLRTSAQPQPEQRGGSGTVPHRGAHEHIRLLQHGEQTLTSFTPQAFVHSFISNLKQKYLSVKLFLSYINTFILCLLFLPGCRRLLPVTELPSCISSAITKTPASQDKTQFHFGFQPNHPLFKIIFTTASTCRTASWIRLLIITVYKKKNQSANKSKYQFTLRWCFETEILATLKLRTRGQLVLPLKKLWRVVDFNGVFLSVPQQTLSVVVVVLNTEICTSRLQFLWGAVFF